MSYIKHDLGCVAACRMSSALQANFQFYGDGRFVYNTSSYDDLNPLYSIGGQYLFEGKTLKLKVLKIKVLENFVTINQRDTTFSDHDVIVGKTSGDGKLQIQIDSDKYFKVAENPDEFTKAKKP